MPTELITERVELFAWALRKVGPSLHDRVL